MMRSLLSSLHEAIVLLVADVAGIFGLFSLAYFLRTGEGMPSHSLSLVWIAAVFLVAMYVFDVYRGVLREGGTKLAIRTALAVLIAAGVMASLVYIVKPLESNALYWRGVLPVATALFLVWAVVWRKILATWMQNRTPARWLVLDATRPAHELSSAIIERVESLLANRTPRAKSRAKTTGQASLDVSP